jgi:hypothetical protein
MSKKTKKEWVRNINLELSSEEDAKIMSEALIILDKAGYTICRKDDCVLENVTPKIPIDFPNI